MLPTTSQGRTSTTHSKEERLEWYQFSSDDTKPAFTKGKTILLKLFWKHSVPLEYSLKYAFCKHIPKYEQTTEYII